MDLYDIAIARKLSGGSGGGGGSSDFSTAEVTITDNGTGSVVWNSANIFNDTLSVSFGVDGGETVPVEIVLYKGNPSYLIVNPNFIPDTPVVTGDIAIESSPFGTVLVVSGDGTITYSSNN